MCLSCQILVFNDLSDARSPNDQTQGTFYIATQQLYITASTLQTRQVTLPGHYIYSCTEQPFNGVLFSTLGNSRTLDI